jgi:hypothetical protein
MLRSSHTHGAFVFVITILISTPFWSKKIKIAILALATFAALC